MILLDCSSITSVYNAKFQMLIKAKVRSSTAKKKLPSTSNNPNNIDNFNIAH